MADQAPAAWQTMGGKYTATASCRSCAWAATHRGDTPQEVGEFLRRLLLDHCQDAHADVVAKRPA